MPSSLLDPLVLQATQPCLCRLGWMGCSWVWGPLSLAKMRRSWHRWGCYIDGSFVPKLAVCWPSSYGLRSDLSFTALLGHYMHCLVCTGVLQAQVHAAQGQRGDEHAAAAAAQDRKGHSPPGFCQGCQRSGLFSLECLVYSCQDAKREVCQDSWGRNHGIILW